MRLSIILPALNESAELAATLASLRPARDAGNEVILVDGGSDDGTPEIAGAGVDRLVVSERGRARQMNAGARQARGELLLFLHADTRPAPGALEALLESLPASGRGWGRFDLRLSGDRFPFRLIEFLINRKSRLTGIATGDQGIFVQRELFERVGGFPQIALMEDVALSRQLKRFGRPLCLRAFVVSSSRRWERRGILRTVLLMWRLRIAFALGADPERLARLYDA